MKLFSVKENSFCKIVRDTYTAVSFVIKSRGYDDISIQFKLGERTRTMRLWNIERLSIVEEIPETLVRERSVDKIRNYMISTADMYWILNK